VQRLFPPAFLEGADVLLASYDTVEAPDRRLRVPAQATRSLAAPV
jgi:hypothetical protein